MAHIDSGHGEKLSQLIVVWKDIKADFLSSFEGAQRVYMAVSHLALSAHLPHKSAVPSWRDFIPANPT